MACQHCYQPYILPLQCISRDKQCRLAERWIHYSPSAQTVCTSEADRDLVVCRVSVLTEALQGKSRWLRKAPLELTHPERLVFEGQQTVLLFAAGSAAKEQWYIALSAATATDGGAGGSVHALYSTFCDYVREHALVAYPQVR